MMGTREPLRGALEYDALTKRGRSALKLFRHAGIAADAKRRFSRRVRKRARRALREALRRGGEG